MESSIIFVIYLAVAFWTTVVSLVGDGDNCLRRGVFWPVYLTGWIVRNTLAAVKDSYRGQ